MYERLLKCEDCGESFWHKVERRSDPNPDECPCCHNAGAPVLRFKAKGKLDPKIASMVEEGRGPATSREIAKSVDSIYRAAEDSSLARSHMAAETLGIDPSETRHMVVTDMKDYLKPGDICAKLPANPVSDAMAAGKNTGFQQTPVQATSGVFNANLVAQTTLITANHHQTANRLVGAGRLATHAVKR